MHAHPSTLCLINDAEPPPISSLSLHDALPICICPERQWLVSKPADPAAGALCTGGRYRSGHACHCPGHGQRTPAAGSAGLDRKSTRLNSSHVKISYAVFCLKKKKEDDKINSYR